MVLLDRRVIYRLHMEAVVGAEGKAKGMMT